MRKETANILSLLDSYTQPTTDDVATSIANNFRSRRVEKGLSRREMAVRSGVALGNIARFEQKGLISLSNLIKLAEALGYLSEVQNIFVEPKYSTMDELQTIRRNAGKTRAYTKLKKD